MSSRDNHERRGSGVVAVVLMAAVGGAAFWAGHEWRPANAGAPGVAAAGGGASTRPVAGKQLWTCSMHPQVIQDHPGTCPICHMELTPLHAVSAHGGAGAGEVTIDPAVVQNMGVRTAEVTRGPLVQSVRVVGYLEEPEPLHHDINLRVSGWIEKLYADTDGMMIKEGQPLFDLYSPELTVAVDELISARRALAGAPHDETSKSLLDSARRKLTQYGLPDKQVDELAKLDAAPRTIPILAPMGGHLTAKKVNEGSAVKAGDLVMRIASRDRMWIDCQVYEQQLPLISDGQRARITLVSQPGKAIEGKVLFVHPHLDPQTRTALVRIEVPNRDMTLREGMYATVEILADSYREATVVPREAVIDTGNKQVAFVSLGEGHFAARELRLGQPGRDGTVEVLDGLKPGETVVTSGQFLIDSESRLREAIAKQVEPTPATPALASVPAVPAKVPVPVATTAPVVVPHTDDIVRAYLELGKRLGQRQESPTPLNPSDLIDVSEMAAMHGRGRASNLAKRVADAAKGLNGQPLPEQRKRFVALSAAVIDLAKASPPSAAVAPKLFVFHCPMAFEDKGADWVQATDVANNPYYATEMKRCGDVTAQLRVTP